MLAKILPALIPVIGSSESESETLDAELDRLIWPSTPSAGCLSAWAHHKLKLWILGSGLLSVQRVGTSRLYALDVDAAALAPLRELADGIGACLAAHT